MTDSNNDTIDNNDIVEQATNSLDHGEKASGEQIPLDDKKEKWSFLWWGLLFFFLWTLILMFVLEATLHPRDSFVATVIAYGLGVLGLGIYGGLVRRKLKGVFTHIYSPRQFYPKASKDD